MKHLQTYELTRQEHADMKRNPFLLIVPPSATAQEITLTVEARRGATATISPVASEHDKRSGVECPDCNATASISGKPFTLTAMKKHRFQAHKKSRKVRGK